jgi:hypothetical protein
MTCIGPAVKDLDRVVPAAGFSFAANSTASVRAVPAARLPPDEVRPLPQDILAYTQPCGCVTVRTAYEATKVPALRIVADGSLPERSAPPVRELQPHLYPAAHEQAPWA